jgi:hypothetical protein
VVGFGVALTGVEGGGGGSFADVLSLGGGFDSAEDVEKRRHILLFGLTMVIRRVAG